MSFTRKPSTEGPSTGVPLNLFYFSHISVLITVLQKNILKLTFSFLTQRVSTFFLKFLLYLLLTKSNLHGLQV